MKVNVLVLAAGHSSYGTNDSGYPLCLAEFDGLTLMERLILNTQSIKNASYTFALLDEEVERYHLDRVVEHLAPGSQVIRVPKGTRGSACTALLAICQFHPQQEVLLISANELVDINFNEVIADFRERRLDGGALIFRSIHPRYSYVCIDNDGIVTEAAQKNPISQHATTGVFWFARAGDLVEAIKNMIRKDASVDGNFYVAPAFNEIILKQGRIGVREIDPRNYHPLKTEKQIHQFEQEVSR
jgi:hypothetical protein